MNQLIYVDIWYNFWYIYLTFVFNKTHLFFVFIFLVRSSEESWILISRMLLNSSADWSRGEINVMPDMIQFFWTPDIIIYDLVRSAYLIYPQNICTAVTIQQHCKKSAFKPKRGHESTTGIHQIDEWSKVDLDSKCIYVLLFLQVTIQRNLH